MTVESIREPVPPRSRRWFLFPWLKMAPVDELEETGTAYRRRFNDAVEPHKPALPPWLLPLVLYLVGQLVGSVWWAATMQSDVRYLQSENAKLWQKIEVLDMQRDKAENGMDERIRAKVRETMDDWGYLRPHKGN